MLRMNMKWEETTLFGGHANGENFFQMCLVTRKSIKDKLVHSIIEEFHFTDR